MTDNLNLSLPDPTDPYVDEPTEQAVQALAGKLAVALDPKFEEQFRDVSSRLSTLLERPGAGGAEVQVRGLEEVERALREIRAKLDARPEPSADTTRRLESLEVSTAGIAQQIGSIETNLLSQLRMMNAQLLLWRKDAALIQRACIRVLELLGNRAGTGGPG